MSLSGKFRIESYKFRRQFLKASAWPQMLRTALLSSLVRATGHDYHPAKPLVLMVEPSSRCNLKCPLCATGTGEVKRQPAELGLDIYKALIDQYSSHLLYILFFNQGEPFLNKDFLDMVSYANEKNIYTITSSNGHYIRSDDDARRIVQSGLDEIAISLDGLTADVYTKYRRGGNFQRVVDGIKRLVRAKKELNSFTPIIELQILLTADTQEQLDEAPEFGRQLGVDVVSAKTLQLLDTAKDRDFLPSKKEHRRYEERDGKLQMRGNLKNRCGRLYYSMSVNSDGSTVPCCFDKSGNFIYGNINNGGVENAWQGHEFTAFRKRVLEDRASIGICTNCTEGIRDLYSRKWYIT